MTDALAVIALVVLVNLGWILSFDRAQRALRDLGAAWVRALSSPSVPHDATEPPDDDPGEPVPQPVEVATRTTRVAAPAPVV
jgi:hypothetical protein